LEVTTAWAIRTYGVFPNSLRLAILMGHLQARKDESGRWLINRDSLDHWNKRRVRRASRIEVGAAATA